jgi:hypothetical protein
LPTSLPHTVTQPLTPPQPLTPTTPHAASLQRHNPVTITTQQKKNTNPKAIASFREPLQHYPSRDPVTRSHHQEFAGDPSFRVTHTAASAPCHAGVTHQQSSISRAATKLVEANPRFSGRGGAIRGVAVRERGSVSCLDHRGGAGRGRILTVLVRGGIGSPIIRSRSAPLPSLCIISQKKKKINQVTIVAQRNHLYKPI